MAIRCFGFESAAATLCTSLFSTCVWCAIEINNTSGAGRGGPGRPSSGSRDVTCVFFIFFSFYRFLNLVSRTRLARRRTRAPVSMLQRIVSMLPPPRPRASLTWGRGERVKSMCPPPIQSSSNSLREFYIICPQINIKRYKGVREYLGIVIVFSNIFKHANKNNPLKSNKDKQWYFM